VVAVGWGDGRLPDLSPARHYARWFRPPGRTRGLFLGRRGLWRGGEAAKVRPQRAGSSFALLQAPSGLGPGRGRRRRLDVPPTGYTTRRTRNPTRGSSIAFEPSESLEKRAKASIRPRQFTGLLRVRLRTRRTLCTPHLTVPKCRRFRPPRPFSRVLSSFRGHDRRFQGSFSHQRRLNYYMNYYMTLRLTDRCSPFRNAVPYSPSAVECRHLSPFAGGVAVRTTFRRCLLGRHLADVKCLCALTNTWGETVLRHFGTSAPIHAVSGQTLPAETRELTHRVCGSGRPRA
jgi:hypothetical protein